MSIPRRALFVHLAACAAALLMAAPADAAGGGNVLPPQASPHGTSLSDMAVLTAVFNQNPVGEPPASPFQILFATSTFTPEGTGFVQSGSNCFTVRPGTMLYVPLVGANDVPPVIEPFPTTHAEALTYFFSPALVGVHDVVLTVDGQETSIGPQFLVGPFPFEQGGTTFHVLQLGVFLTPLSPGVHHVSFTGQVSGVGFAETFGFSPLIPDFTFTIDVTQDHRPSVCPS